MTAHAYATGPSSRTGTAIGELLAIVARSRPAWQADAACREHHELDWFPARGERGDAAKAVCADCLVRDECLSWAVAAGDDLKGVWGGTGDRERRRIRSGEDLPARPNVTARPGRVAATSCANCGGRADHLQRGLCATCHPAWRATEQHGRTLAAWLADWLAEQRQEA